mmetsp:Transcript_30097/g.58028  ORF Transcript_30097/g.58028 Transcript_30097/m.58028 type:complete len:231 (-) Transcript_30097:370-1062(-)
MHASDRSWQAASLPMSRYCSNVPAISVRMPVMEFVDTVRRICVCPENGLSRSRYRLRTTSSRDVIAANNSPSVLMGQNNDTIVLKMLPAPSGPPPPTVPSCTTIPALSRRCAADTPSDENVRGMGSSSLRVVRRTYEIRIQNDRELRITKTAGGTACPSLSRRCVRRVSRASTCREASLVVRSTRSLVALGVSSSAHCRVCRATNSLRMGSSLMFRSSSSLREEKASWSV